MSCPNCDDKSVSAQARWQRRKLATGKCMRCGGKARPVRYCQVCATKIRLERFLRRMGKAKP